MFFTNLITHYNEIYVNNKKNSQKKFSESFLVNSDSYNFFISVIREYNSKDSISLNKIFKSLEFNM